MINNFSWSLQDIENMYCWEREIYIKLVSEYQERKRQDESQKINGANYFKL